MRTLWTVFVAGIAALAAQASLSPRLSAAQLSPNKPTLITGIVTNAQGAAMAGLTVRLWSVYEDGSGTGLQREPTAVTDATGRYVLAGVPRGTYLVESVAAAAEQSPRPRVPEAGSMFHPGTPVANEARLIVVASEQRIAGIDIVHRARRLARIWGRALDAGGEALRESGTDANRLRPQIELIPATDSARIRFSTRETAPGSDGSFSFAHVQPGTYILRATQTARPAIPRVDSVVRAIREVAIERITIGEADVGNLPLRLRTTRNVSGRIIIDAKAPPAPPARFNLTAEHIDPAADPAAIRSVPPVVSIFEDGALVIEGLIGAGRVFFSNPPKGGWYLAAIRSATGEVIDGPIPPGIAEPIALVMKDDAVTLSGTLTGFDAAASPQLSVALFPVDPRRWDWQVVRTTRVAADFPHYFFESVPPGEYLVAAYPTKLNATRPVTLLPLLGTLAPLARRVTITSRQHLSVDLPTVTPRW